MLRLCRPLAHSLPQTKAVVVVSVVHVLDVLAAVVVVGVVAICLFHLPHRPHLLTVTATAVPSARVVRVAYTVVVMDVVQPPHPCLHL